MSERPVRLVCDSRMAAVARKRCGEFTRWKAFHVVKGFLLTVRQQGSPKAAQAARDRATMISTAKFSRKYVERSDGYADTQHRQARCCQ